jgi:hypothetical protein
LLALANIRLPVRLLDWPIITSLSALVVSTPNNVEPAAFWIWKAVDELEAFWKIVGLVIVVPGKDKVPSW